MRLRPGAVAGTHLEETMSLTDQQRRFYENTLAVTKLLALDDAEAYAGRFGGVLYCFLRGYDESGGLWSARPSWEDIVTWRRDLARLRDVHERGEA